MKVQLLPSSIENGVASQRQRLTTFLLDDLVAIDAGSLPFGCSDAQRQSVRDIVLSHTHLDHIAGLPIFIDDLFATLESPVRVHASRGMIDVLEKSVFNWDVYPRFSDLSNDFGSVLEYVPFEFDTPFSIEHFDITAIEVDHHGPSAGFLIRDGMDAFGFTGDTSATEKFWTTLNDEPRVAAVFVECSFPNRLQALADRSNHLTPERLGVEIGKLHVPTERIFVTNIKASYRDEVISEIAKLRIPNVEIMTIGEVVEL
ncbi:MAG: 3',5'-cyclic-nucleotide phosphodiesterase [Blastocatellia bacterium]|nr:3',5'-cyclic-nucleotide phosphodiesterase [Blastocatellia bacterium]